MLLRKIQLTFFSAIDIMLPLKRQGSAGGDTGFFFESAVPSLLFEAFLPKKGKASPHSRYRRFRQKSALQSVGMKLVGDCKSIENLTVAPTTERQTSQLRLTFLFRQKQKAVRDNTPERPENSVIRLLTLDFHAHFDTIRV